MVLSQSAIGTGVPTPGDAFLRDVIKRRFPAYLDELAAEGCKLPDFVVREFELALACGDFKTFHATFACQECPHQWKICLRCKRRGWCPACMVLRQNDRTRFLQERIIGNTPIRQYVLTLPPPLRMVLAFRPDLVSKVLRQFLKIVFAYLSKAAKKLLRARGEQFRSVRVGHLRPGAVTAIQRFATDISLNLHFHSLVTNGVFVKVSADEAPWFLELPEPSSDDIASLASKICRWTCDLLEGEGLWQPVHEASESSLDIVAGYFNDRARGWVFYRYCGVASDQETDRPVGRDGIYAFDVYARESIRGGDHKNLRRLIRYVLSPPFTAKQLRPDPTSADHALIDLKRPMRDGTVTLRLTIRQLIERLVWATPRPNAHLLRFHGVYASHAALREVVTPEPPPKYIPPTATEETPEDYEAWGEFHSHSFRENRGRCPMCGGKPKLIALKTDRIMYRRRSGVPPGEEKRPAIIYLRKRREE
jgi:hypothetical protein